jgi:hypothetical protein
MLTIKVFECPGEMFNRDDMNIKLSINLNTQTIEASAETGGVIRLSNNIKLRDVIKEALENCGIPMVEFVDTKPVC